MSGSRQIAKRLGLGRLAYKVLHEPLGKVRQSLREGGPLEQWCDERGRRAMVEAAAHLPTLVDHGNPLPFAANFLSGEKYWYQTLFCALSLQLQIDRRIDIVVFDDGSFTEATMRKMRQVMPWMRFRSAAQALADLDRFLPECRFPALRKRRLEYPHLRKLTDIHCAANDWTLVFDSDMLFFRRPDTLLDWMRDPARPFFLSDTETAYGYSADLLEELAGGPVPDRVNVGLYALNGSAIDWADVERWCGETIAREGSHYLQEQALVALLLAGHDAIRLPEADYVVMPTAAEGEAPRAVLHHYVAESKRSYFRHTWPMVFREAHAGAGNFSRRSFEKEGSLD